MSEKKDADELTKAIIKIDAGPLTPFTPSAEYNFVTGYSSAEEGGHVVIFSNPNNPFDTVKVVVDPMNDPVADTMASGGSVKLTRDGTSFTIDLEGSYTGQNENSRRNTESEQLSSDSDNSTTDSGIGFPRYSGDETSIDVIIPSLQTLGENQQVILTDVRAGFSQTYENQQQIYNKLKAQEQMLAKVAAGVAGLTAVTYAIQQQINTLVILFGVAFLIIVAALGFLIWKQTQMEKRMMYMLMRRR